MIDIDMAYFVRVIASALISEAPISPRTSAIDSSGTPEKIAGLLRQIADGIQPETLFSLGN
jgi:hypothetical protein